MNHTLQIHKMITGTTGKGVAKRSLAAYTDYWGIEISKQLKGQAQQYFSAKEAAELLKA